MEVWGIKRRCLYACFLHREPCTTILCNAPLAGSFEHEHEVEICTLHGPGSCAVVCPHIGLAWLEGGDDTAHLF
jgi:hypothetical protein